VTLARYEQIVAESRERVAQTARCQWRLGDHTLEIKPIRPHGGAHPGPDQELFTVVESLQRFADDLRVSEASRRPSRWLP
jgi:hypothetical protein